MKKKPKPKPPKSINALELLAASVAEIGPFFAALPAEGQFHFLRLFTSNLLIHCGPEATAEMMAVAKEPCGKPGCQCEVPDVKFVEALIAINEHTMKESTQITAAIFASGPEITGNN